MTTHLLARGNFRMHSSISLESPKLDTTRSIICLSVHSFNLSQLLIRQDICKLSIIVECLYKYSGCP